MLAGMLTIWQFATSKVAWILSGLFLLGFMAVRIGTAIIQTGEQSERLKQYEQTIRDTNKEKQVNATIDRLSDADVRKRMLNDWSRN